MGSFWFNLLASILVVVVVQAIVVKLYYVPSGSMEQTLEVGDRIVVNRLAFGFAEPATGDVVVFAASKLWGSAPAAPANPIVYGIKWLGGLLGIGPDLDHVLVKRVVALPGQTVSCCDAEGRVLVDGIPLNEPYIYGDFPFVRGLADGSTTPESGRCFGPVTVPAGEYFVLGDHRRDSDDSIAACRGAASPAPICLKFVGRADLVGRVAVVVWPPAHWGTF